MRVQRLVYGSAIAMTMSMFVSTPSDAEVVAYPTLPGTTTSPDFAVSVNGTAVWVEKAGPGRSEEEERYTTKEDLNVANFSCAGELSVKVKVFSGGPITHFVIRPKSRKIAAQINGDEISFTVPGPQKLYVEVNKKAHLAIFANPLEKDPPAKDDPNVTYFAPGVHTGDIALKSDHTYYLAGGALVKGNIHGAGLTNVKVIGRGCIDGRVMIRNSSNVEFSGVFIRNSQAHWTVPMTECKQSTFRNVKIFSYGEIGCDGIDAVACQQFTIDDCFFRCRDDCVAIKSWPATRQPTIGITVTNSVMVGWHCSDGVTLGFELDTDVRDVLVRNCDVLYSSGPGTTTGHCAFSITCDGPGTVSNIRFEDIRAEDGVTNNAVELVVTPANMWGSKSGKPGHIKGVTIKNCSWENARPPFRITGYGPENLVEDVTFDHCTVAGKPLTDVSQLVINQFVRNIRFIQDDVP